MELNRIVDMLQYETSIYQGAKEELDDLNKLCNSTESSELKCKNDGEKYEFTYGTQKFTITVRELYICANKHYRAKFDYVDFEAALKRVLLYKIRESYSKKEE